MDTKIVKMFKFFLLTVGVSALGSKTEKKKKSVRFAVAEAEPKKAPIVSSPFTERKVLESAAKKKP